MTHTLNSIADEYFQSGLDYLTTGEAKNAVRAFRRAIAADNAHIDAHHGLVRALRDAGRLNQSIAVAMALISITPNDPLAHTALSISLQHAGHIEKAESAAARARILEWKAELNQVNRDSSK